jgi:hypothetical protein
MELPADHRFIASGQAAGRVTVMSSLRNRALPSSSLEERLLKFAENARDCEASGLHPPEGTMI